MREPHQNSPSINDLGLNGTKGSPDRLLQTQRRLNEIFIKTVLSQFCPVQSFSETREIELMRLRVQLEAQERGPADLDASGWYGLN